MECLPLADNAQKKRGLGRGLANLLGEAEAAYQHDGPSAAAAAPQPASNGRTLPLAFLRPGKYQPRRQFDETALAELADSIRAHGLLQPILVRPIESEADKYEIVAGERRWRAAQRAGLHDVPVTVQPLTDTQALEIALVENLQRQDLTALEEAEGYQRLIDEFGHSHGELGKLVGKSRSHVANMLRLLGLPEAVKTMVQAGTLSPGHARALLTAADPSALAEAVAQRGLSVRDTERLAGEMKGPKAGAPAQRSANPASKHADLLALERNLTERLGLRVTINAQGAGGTLSVVYRTLDQLDAVLDKLSRSN
jgi:ParB family chromosome partitioning protein